MHWIAEVAVDVRTKQLDRLFDYLVPSDLEGRAVPGARVLVSFGNRHVQAYILSVRQEAEPTDSLKPVLSVLDDKPLLTPELLKLVDWLQYRCVCTRLEAIQTVIPSAFRIKRLGGTDESAISSATDKVQAKTVAVLRRVQERALLEEHIQTRSRKAPKQTAILEKLLHTDDLPLSELGLQPSNPAVTALTQAGLVEVVHVETYRAPDAGLAEREPSAPRTLTKVQLQAYESILSALDNAEVKQVVVHGVTGSGKTEVYLQVIAHCLKNGRGAIVLVPEISLTPQMVGRFVSRFGPSVAVLHSGLSAGEKRDEWLRVRRGEATIVVGARSAVFAPVANLGLIVVDEEHESSYKQEESPRYDAREVATERARRHGGLAVFGSATPSLSIMHEVEGQRARLVSLPFRVNGKPLPLVDVVDMREELKSGNRTIFSRKLMDGLDSAIAQGRQAILFLNRRGYASFVLCRNCGDMVKCPHCDISLTLHKARGRTWLACHYCEYEMVYTEECPTCRELALRPFGLGTQQVEHLLCESRPDWRVLRMDVDTTRRKGAHRDAITQFLNGEADILLGTQMIAKGLDFPNVAFVGVITADTMLAVPDYRAAERTFSLLTQVAGRAGRAEVEGRTVIQTYRPEHYSVTCAAHHDYGSFYRRERELREAFSYPPFCELTVFMAVHAEERMAESCAKRFERELRRSLPEAGTQVLPAVPSGIARVEDKYRYQVVVKYSRWDAVQVQIRRAYGLVSDKMRKAGGTCTLDVGAGRF